MSSVHSAMECRLKFQHVRFIGAGTVLMLLLCMSCSGGDRAATTSRNIRKILKSENSYYHYLSSEVSKSNNAIDQAEIELEQALKKDPRSSFLWSQKAITSAGKTNWNEAIVHVKKSLELDPRNFDALVLLGKLQAANRQPDLAIVSYKSALELNRKSEELYNVMAREYISLKQIPSAIATLKTCLVQLPETMSCIYYLASIHIQEKNYEEALRYFNMVLVLNPDNVRVLQTIGEIHLELKNQAKAIEVFEQVKLIEPNDMASVIRLGLMYYERKELDRAIAEFEYVYERFPRSDRVNYFLGMLNQEKKSFEKAYEYFNNIDSSSPFFKEAVTRMIAILRSMNKPKEAALMLEQKIAKKDQDEQFHRIRVSLLMTTFEFKPALNAVEQALVQHKNQPDLMFQKAIILEKMDRWKESKSILKELANHPQATDRVFNYLGYTILVRDGEIDEGLRYISKAIELNPKDGHIVDSQAWGYFLKNDFEKALELLLKADRMTPDEPTIQEHLGDVYFKLKNKHKARYHYERSLRILSDKKQRSPDEDLQIEGIRKKLGDF